jgi:hypothetical protein
MMALKLTQPVDFIALRSTGQRTIHEFEAAGTPCAQASDKRLCEAELRRVGAETSVATQPHLVFTRGDTVRALRTLEEKLSLLGTIDTPDEALLVLQHNGVHVGCGAVPGMEMTQVRVRDDGYRIVTHTPLGCGNQFYRRFFDVDHAGNMSELADKAVTVGECFPSPIQQGGSAAGRRPPNLLAFRRRPTGASALARYFARVAWLEAASVPAFEQLADELRILGAPRGLRQAALHAAEDEVRHARDTAALAEHFGARPQTPSLARRRLRGRAEVALDNALEGCVHETYAAYLATAQARLARAPRLREPLQRIAQDETRHAALAWQIAAWIEPQLPNASRLRIAARRESALQALGT